MIKTNLSNEEYREKNAVSKSDLDLVRRSPALIEWNKLNPAPGSISVENGTLIHAMTLEPEIFDLQYALEPEEFSSQTMKNAFYERAKTKKIIGKKRAVELVSMRDSIMAHPVARELLTSEGVSELSVFSEIEGISVKCRPDRVCQKHGLLVDVKKTADIETFERSAIKLRYYVQHAFYSDVCERAGIEFNGFVFIVVGEKKQIGRHPVEVVELSDSDVDRGRAEYIEDLEKYKDYIDFGVGIHARKVKLFNK